MFEYHLRAGLTAYRRQPAKRLNRLSGRTQDLADIEALVVIREVHNAKRSVHFGSQNLRKRRAISGGDRDKLVESFGGSIPSEGLAGAAVEEVGDLIEVVLGVG